MKRTLSASCCAILFPVCLAACLAGPALAADRTWDGGGDGTSWADAANWSDDTVPAAGDHALVGGTAAVRLTGGATVLRLTLSATATLSVESTLTLGTGGGLVGAGATLVLKSGTYAAVVRTDGPLRVEGRLEWGAYAIVASYAGQALAVAPGATMRLFAREEQRLEIDLVNEGTVRWEDGPMNVVGRTFTNRGTFEVALTTNRDYSLYAGGAFENTGTVRKTGTGTATLYAPMRTVGGLFDVREGGLVQERGSRWQDATVAVAAGATLRLGASLASEPHVVAGTLTGTPAGTLIADGNFPYVAADPAGGVLDVGGTGFQVGYAQLGTGAATPSLAAPTNRGLLRFTGGADHYIRGAFANEGTLRWEDGRFLVQNAPFTNAGLLEMAVAAARDLWAEGSGVVVNTGTIRKVGAPTVTSNGRLHTAGGTVDVREGVLLHQGGSRWEEATVAVATGATLHLAVFIGGGRTVVAGSLAGDLEGTFLVSGISGYTTALVADPARGGRLALSGAGLQLGDAHLGWFGGVTVPLEPAPVNAGLLRLVGGYDPVVDAPFVNEGTVRWEAGYFRIREGARLTNAGRFDVVGAGLELRGGSDPNAPSVFSNAGTFRQAATAGTTTSRMPFENGGRLEVDGALTFTGAAALTNLPGGVVSGTGTLTPGTSASNAGAVAPGPGEGGSGTGTLAWAAPYASGRELAVELGPGGARDVLAATGAATLDGLLVVRVLPGYTPQPGDAFTVLTAPAVAGAFDAVATANAVNGVQFEAEVTAEGVRVRAVAGGGGAVVLAEDTLVVRGVRRVVLAGAGAAAVTAVRLRCAASCAAAGGANAVAGVLRDTLGLRTATFDLRDPAAMGVYEVLVDGVPSGQRVAVAPLVAASFAAFTGIQGIPVLPAPALRFNALAVRNVTNGPDRLFTVYALTPPRPDVVRFSLLGSPEPPHDGDSTRYVLVSQPPNTPNALVLAMGWGVSPGDVSFPPAAGGPVPPPRARHQLGGPLPFGGTVPAGVETSVSLTRAEFAEAMAHPYRNNPEFYTDVLAAANGALDQFHNPSGSFEGGATGGMLFELMYEYDRRFREDTGSPPISREAYWQTFADDVSRLEEGIEHLRQREAEAVARQRSYWDRFWDGVEDYIDEDLAPLFDPGVTLEAYEELQEDPAPQHPYRPWVQELIIRGPWDPNDKATAPTAGGCALGRAVVDGVEVPRCTRYYLPLAQAGEPIRYQITFENLAAATAPAEDVVVTDVLPDALDPSTLRVLATSADAHFSYTVRGQTVTFTFAGIDLPPNVNAPEGEGFVDFTVRPRAGLVEGDEIRNRARIVFDFNPPILTPEVVHEVGSGPDGGGPPTSGPVAFALEEVYPNPFTLRTRIGYALAEGADVRLEVFDVLGRRVAVLVDAPRPAGRHEAVFDAAALPSGVYLCRLAAGGRSAVRRMLRVR